MTNAKTRTTDIETVLGCGGYQIFIFVIYQTTVFLQCANMVFMSFGKVTPSKWYCLGDSENATDQMHGQNGNISFWTLNESEQCDLFSNGQCMEFYWETDFYSIVPEWQLLCNRTAIVYLIISMQMLGVLIGSGLFGQLSDMFGRKWTLFFSELLLVLLDALSIFSPSWEIYLTFRFFIGICCGGTITISYVYLTEVLKARHRLWVTAIAGWPPSFAVFALLAFVTRDWKRLSLATAALGVPTLLMIPLAVESPRWQLQKQKLDKAQRSVERVLKWNRADEIAKTRLAHIIGNAQECSHPLRSGATRRGNKKYTFWHLCQTRKLATTTFVLIFAFLYKPSSVEPFSLSISMITYGVILNNDKLIGDKYLNFVLFACIRWIFSILTPVVDIALKNCGRKLTSTVSFALISMAATAISLIITFAPNGTVSGNVITGLVLFASMMTSPIWNSLNLSSVEAFPTPIRNVAVGLLAVFTRLGGVIVPVFLYMAELWKPSPYVLFASMSLISAVLCGLLLPETKGKALPDNMPQRQNRWWRCCCNSEKRPRGPLRSDSFTLYRFNRTRVS